MDKKEKLSLSERDICTKFITPAIEKSGWDIKQQMREEVSFTDGRIYVKGHLTSRGQKKRADYILYYKPNMPLAVVEAKDNTHSVRSGIQQALDYSKHLDVPFVFSSNGDGFLFHDKTSSGKAIETELTLDQFPSPEILWRKYCIWKGISSPEIEKIISQDYFFDSKGRSPRYYQQIAINRTVEAVAMGQKRALLVMATGTGKTYTAFQIVYRLWKAGLKKRILFLADRTALVDQTRRGDFRHFKDKLTIIKKKILDVDGKESLVSNKKRGIDTADKAYEVFLGLYQGLTDADGIEDAYKDFDPDFFDLIVIDECHRGSAKEDSSWRQILEYFKKATHLGLTATPKETKDVSNIEYFGEPLYTYSLKQGIEDGFLAPYRVIRINLNVDVQGFRPKRGQADKFGNEIADAEYGTKDFDRTIVIDERTETVAKKVTEFLRGAGRFSKTIIFCVDIEHAERMRSALVKNNSDLFAENNHYIMQITGDNEEGKRELDNFINPESKYPVLVTTSKLLTTGVDAQTCKVIVLDNNIESMTEFKQIIGRGTRINEEYGKLYFTILDFRNVTRHFADRSFDGDPVKVKEADPSEDISNTEKEEIDTNDPQIDENGNEIVFPGENNTKNEGTSSDEGESTPRQKYYVDGVDVTVLIEREVILDRDGKPITISLKDFTKEIIRKKFRSMDQFIKDWTNSDKRDAIVQELNDQGVSLEQIEDQMDHQLDSFDMICHLAFDAPPLTKSQRVKKVQKNSVFNKYGREARAVIEALLQKYADGEVSSIDNLEVLKLPPLDKFGTPIEILKVFGGRDKFLEVIGEVQQALYSNVG
jgi:type I restriction enzyme R subunit